MKLINLYFFFLIKRIHTNITLLQNFPVLTISSIVVISFIHNYIAILITTVIYIKNKYLLITTLLLLVLANIYTSSVNSRVNLEKRQDYYKRELSITVQEIYKVDDFTQSIIAKTDKYYSRILLKIPKYPAVYRNQHIKLVTKLSSIEDNHYFTPAYKKYLASRNIHLQGNADKFEQIQTKVHTNLLDMHGFSTIISNQINRNFSITKASLIIGLLLGNQSDFREEFQDQIRLSGVSHIVSASGFNVGLILLLILRFEGRLKRKTIYLGGIAGIYFYLSIIGFYNIAALRAALMLTLILISKILGRKTNILLVLNFSIIIMLLLYPGYLYNISFQLSIAATVGVIIYTNYSKVILNLFKKLPAALVEIYFCTIFISFTTLPIIYISFREVTFNSLISNILILPALPIIIFGALIELLLAPFLVEPLENLLISIIDLLLTFIIKVIQISSQLPFGKISDLYFIILTFLAMVILLLVLDIRKVVYETKK